MDKSHLTLVDPSHAPQGDEAEFTPLPYYPWSERPITVPLDQDECATALHLAHGSLPAAANLLKVPLVRLARMLRSSPRLQRVLDEAYQLTLAKAVSIPIETLFDPNADARRLEWASTKVLASRLAMGAPLSPAPASSAQSSASLTVSNGNKTFRFRWRTPEDDVINTTYEEKASDDSD